MDSTLKKFDELTEYEQSVVKGGVGWDGTAYTDKDGLRIVLATDSDQAMYEVVYPEGVAQDEVVADETAPAEPEVAPETEPSVADDSEKVDDSATSEESTEPTWGTVNAPEPTTGENTDETAPVEPTI